MKILKLFLMLFLSCLACGETHHIHFSDDDKWGDLLSIIKEEFRKGVYDMALKNNEKELPVSPNGFDWKLLRRHEEIQTGKDGISLIHFEATKERYIMFVANLFNDSSHNRHNLSLPLFTGCKGVVLLMYAPPEMRMRDVYTAYGKCVKSVEPYSVLGVLLLETQP